MYKKYIATKRQTEICVTAQLGCRKICSSSKIGKARAKGLQQLIKMCDETKGDKQDRY